MLRTTISKTMSTFRQSLDSYDDRPTAMTRYLKHYGWHFNKALFEYAASLMYKGNEEHVEPCTKQKVDELLKRYGVEVKNNILHDAAYVATKCKADNLGGSVPDEHHMVLYVKETLDDADGPDGMAMAMWYAKMCRAGIGIDWEDML